jgi:NRPS condensation-like uncharacterized protein
VAEPELTIANMASAYILPITVAFDDGFDATLKQVHELLRLRKEYRRCFLGLRTLGLLGDILPPTIAHRVERMIGFMMPFSYTNIGSFDEQKLRFDGCVVTDCFLAGPYQQVPIFQLSVSSFRDDLCLCNTVFGSDRHRDLCQNVMQQIKSELVTRP